MDYESLPRAQQVLTRQALTQTHRRQLELVILTLDDEPVRSLVNPFLGGAIHGDVSRSPVEVLEARILDTDAVLDWTNGAHRRFKVQIIDRRFVTALNEWVEWIIFTGPIWDFERRGAEVTLFAQGSERLAMGSVRSVFQRPRKTRASEVIRDLLKEAGAPNRALRIPRLAHRLPERVTVGVRRGKVVSDKKANRQVLRATREDSYLPEASKVAEAVDRELFTDGSGDFVLRPPQSRPSVQFTNETLLSPPIERRPDDGEQFNTWLIFGADPKGPKGRVHAEVALPPRHPLSRKKLAWNGKPREVTERIENSHLRTKKQAQTLGERRRDKALRELMEYEIEALPCVPWLRPNALVTIPIEGGGKAQVRVKQWTLPLGPSPDPLVIGANRRSTR